MDALVELEVGTQELQELWELEDMPSDGDSGDSGNSGLGHSSQVQQSAVHVPAVAAASAGFDVSRWDFVWAVDLPPGFHGGTKGSLFLSLVR